MNSAPTLQLGLRANLPQFLLLVLVNAFVGGMVGIERSILPELAQQEFGLAERRAILSFIAVFGVTKAAANYFAGRLGDRWGRKPVLIAGWLIAVGAVMPLMEGYPVPVWNFYIGVDDIDRAHAAVTANGGTITNEPMEIPGGEFAMNAIDPQGAAIGFVGPRKS